MYQREKIKARNDSITETNHLKKKKNGKRHTNPRAMEAEAKREKRQLKEKEKGDPADVGPMPKEEVGRASGRSEAGEGGAVMAEKGQH